MKTKKYISKQFTINWWDVSRALLMAILTPVLVIVQASIDAGTFTLNWKGIAMAGVAGGMSYILKQFFAPTKIVTETKEIVE